MNLERNMIQMCAHFPVQIVKKTTNRNNSYAKSCSFFSF